ncbi:MAG TPA: hypothetical protein VGS17_07775 [Candidatus Limnocylindria bacterium]|nr:hypothetical protein [Candidatus Limnocylindria bacterium]
MRGLHLSRLSGASPVEDVARAGQQDAEADDAVMDFVKARITDYKRVREVEFIDKVPRMASGKILRRELAERERAKIATP